MKTIRYARNENRKGFYLFSDSQEWDHLPLPSDTSFEDLLEAALREVWNRYQDKGQFLLVRQSSTNTIYEKVRLAGFSIHSPRRVVVILAGPQRAVHIPITDIQELHIFDGTHAAEVEPDFSFAHP